MTPERLYWYLAGEVGMYLGWGRGEPNGDVAWDTHQLATIKSIVASGLRRFYKPLIDETGNSHSWSFLKPQVSIQLVPDQKDVLLPVDFAGVEDKVVCSAASGTSWYLWHTASPPLTNGQPGIPAIWYILPYDDVDRSDPVYGAVQRYKMCVLPVPNNYYTLTFRYIIEPSLLTGEYPIAYGGLEHLETMLESCLAVAEERSDDTAGVHTARFMQLLRASIARDSKRQPSQLGAMVADHGGARDGYFTFLPPVRYKGEVPS